MGERPPRVYARAQLPTRCPHCGGEPERHYDQGTALGRGLGHYAFCCGRVLAHRRDPSLQELTGMVLGNLGKLHEAKADGRLQEAIDEVVSG